MNFYISRLSFCIGLICFSTTFGQNLVVNQSFEDFTTCPVNFMGVNAMLEEVSVPTASSGDYFNTCSASDFGVPTNFKGDQEAADGNGYLGLYYYALNNYREYAQLNTARTLREKFPHKISIKVSLAETSAFAIKNMTILLSDKKIKMPNSSTLKTERLELSDISFQEVALSPDKSMAESDGWITMSGEFEAKGFENHIIIGNFEDNANTQLLKNDKPLLSSDFSYYFVDDLVLEELPRVNYEKDKIYVLEQTPYEPKGYELDASAMASVKKIFKFLKENAEVQMKITGHSDNSGTPEYNKYISSLRARAVAIYLKKLGIAEDRLVWEGVGDSKPLRNGKIKEKTDGQRVEFVMTNFED